MATIWIKRSFHGGIHPPEHKHLSSLVGVKTAALPKEVILPLASGNGPALKPQVEVGDKVKTGQLIASCAQGFAANLHASISGEVTGIEARPLVHPSGLSVPSIVIKSDGQDRHFEHPAYPLWREATDEQLLEVIQQAGLVGLGGAGFPSAIKIQGAYQQAKKQGIKTLIINAAECEPYITADDLLIQTQANELLEGIAILQRLLRPEAILLGIEDNKPEAIAALETALKEHPLQTELDICILPTRYPSGGEKQLIQLLTGQEVPSGKLPIDLGVLCHNVGTLYALHAAITLGQPLIQRLVTVTGQTVSQPGNYWVRLGTPISQLLAEVGTKTTAKRLIIGGPMMGFTLDSDNYPIIKSVNCLLLPTEKELPLPGVEQPCIRCGQCELACPAQLLPQQLYFYSANQAYEQAADQQLFDCIECGACAWVCPSEIPLVQYYRHAKAELRQMQAEAVKAEQAKQRFEARNARLEKEALEKEAKRKARAEATARMAAAKKAAAEKEASQPLATEAKGTNPAVASEAALDDKKLKQLKTAKAAATVAVRKAEKTLSNLEVNPDATPEQIHDQLVMIDKAKEQLAKAEAKLAEADPLQETAQ